MVRYLFSTTKSPVFPQILRKLQEKVRQKAWMEKIVSFMIHALWVLFQRSPSVWSVIDQWNSVWWGKAYGPHLDKWLDMTLKADLHTTWRGKNKITVGIQGEKNLCGRGKDVFRLMRDIEQQEDQQAITMIGVLCLARSTRQRLWRGRTSTPSSPVSTGARCSLECKLLQAWQQQSMHSTLFISK